MHNYLIVGSGLYGATVARQLVDAGKSVLVIDKRSHIAGNVYTEKVEGINVHIYGAHIFHTNNKTVWDYIVVQFSRQKSEDFLVSPKREAEWTGGSPVDGYAA